MPPLVKVTGGFGGGTGGTASAAVAELDAATLVAGGADPEASADALLAVATLPLVAGARGALGSPQATNNFGSEAAWYYIGEKVQQTAFGMELSKERTVLAVYFDKNGKVLDTERLGVKDGKVFTMDSRRTPSYGQDRTFIESIISSF